MQYLESVSELVGAVIMLLLYLKLNYIDKSIQELKTIKESK